MSKPILFVAHGMGKHTAGWESEITDSLSTAMKSFSAFKLSVQPPIYDRFSDYAKVIPLTYDHLFEKQRQAWANDSSVIIKKMKDKPSSNWESQLSDVEALSLLNLQSSLAEDSFFNTHVLDVLLYRFTNTGERVRVYIAKQIVKELKANSQAGLLTFGLLGHSLGTSVLHDTLHVLYSHRKWRKDKVSTTFTPGNYKASYLAMISNVSRVLQSSREGTKAYQSKVRPGPGGVCKEMLSISHDYDPFTQLKPFTPGDSWLASNHDAFRAIHLNSVTSSNTHSITHYLQNPMVHIPILKWFSAEGSIPDSEASRAFSKYKTKTLNSGHKELTQALKSLKIAEPSSWQEVFKAWRDYSDILEQFEDLSELNL